MKKLHVSAILLIVSLLGWSQSPQSPAQFLGYPLGTYFSRHHQVVDYFRQLQLAAPSVIQVTKYGETNEHRELIVAYISSPENLKKLEEIRTKHSELKSDENISIVWLSYNVHGNESAGTEAAMQTAYELVTQRQDLLEHTLVILDPCINPDGRDRYVNWYNQKTTSLSNANKATVEHNEPWPSGRPNHYLFDLNRDWAWLTQKESQQRIALYNLWLPHVHVDFHEQGMNDPYYFAPAAEPYHEVITTWQREFQQAVGKNNARYFDKNGWFYFTREVFDLLYPSYGDTYPMYTGAVGMTYEQGGSGRGGLSVINNNGDSITLVNRALHHHTTGMSTVEYAHLKTSQLINEYQLFAKNKNYKYKSYVVGGNTEKVRLLRNLLDAHKIIYTFGNGGTVKGFDYTKNAAGTLTATKDYLVLSTNQLKGTLLNVLFEPKTALKDSLTYDITAWSLPYAYGLNAIASETAVQGTTEEKDTISNTIVKGAYAYLTEWNSMEDARFLTALMKEKIRVRFAENPFILNEKKYRRGTLIITRGDNKLGFDQTVVALATKMHIQLTPTPTGLVDSGNDFGSSSVKLIKTPTVGMLTSDGASSLNVGEIWHFFEQDLHLPLSVYTMNELTESELNTLHTLIIPEGYYSELTQEGTMNSLKKWVSNGGKLIVIGEALSQFTGPEFGLIAKENDTTTAKNDTEKHEHQHVQYAQQERESIKKMITGALFSCKVDETNPLAFGYGTDYVTLKLSAQSYTYLADGANVVYLDEKPVHLAGFVGCEAKPAQAKSLIIGEKKMGAGSMIYFVDNPLFRGFWENGKLFFVNAVFLANN